MQSDIFRTLLWLLSLRLAAFEVRLDIKTWLERDPELSELLAQELERPGRWSSPS